jgi:hypothetical protein
MALPTLYVHTGGTSLGSGSTDTTNPTHSSTIDSVTVSVSGTTVTFSGSIDLSAVPTDGSATIFINDATNSNAKIFKITAVDDGAETVTVSVAPTGVISTSTWGIGGQFVYDSARFEASLAPGWTLTFRDTPASKTTDFLTQRTSGDQTNGFIKVIGNGSGGARVPLTITNTTQVIDGGGNYWWFENLEFIQQGASGNVTNVNTGNVFYNVKISDGGGNGFVCSGSDNIIVRSEVSGCAVGVELPATGNVQHNYIHDVTDAGLSSGSANQAWKVIQNIFDTCAGNGIFFFSTSTTSGSTLISGNTIYGCGNSGVQVSDAQNMVILTNNIFQDNGNAAGEYNVEYTAGSAELYGVHYNNIFYHQGGGGGANLSGLTVNSTELTTDPLFVDAASGNFAVSASSPAKAAGHPGAMPGGLSTGYLDIGAVQRQESAGGGSFAFVG